jgi:hypothetical protein
MEGRSPYWHPEPRTEPPGMAETGGGGAMAAGGELSGGEEMEDSSMSGWGADDAGLTDLVGVG